jgi:tetratricopeptide (TPR) repeat protein
VLCGLHMAALMSVFEGCGPATQATTLRPRQLAEESASPQSKALEPLAYAVLALEAEALPTSPEMVQLLDRVHAAAKADFAIARARLMLLPERQRAVATLNLIEQVLQRFRFVYPAVGYVETLSDALAPLNVDDAGLRRLSDEYENEGRKVMIDRSATETFHIADCDVFSILYVSIGEVLGLPIRMVDLPEPPRAVGHDYVSWTLSDGSSVAWEASSGTERDSATGDAYFFRAEPKPLKQAIEARAFAVPLSREETLAYWYWIVGSIWNQRGSYVRALASYRTAIQKSPFWPKARNELVWLRATAPDPAVRDAAEAIVAGEELLRIWPSANYLDTVAAAYAADGRWDDAVGTQERAVHQAQVYDPKAAGFNQRLSEYRHHRRFLQSRHTEEDAIRWSESLRNPRWQARSRASSSPPSEVRSEGVDMPGEAGANAASPDQAVEADGALSH